MTPAPDSWSPLDAVVDRLLGAGGSPPSVHSVLAGRADRARAGDDAALEPGPKLNAALGQLVELAIAPFQPPPAEPAVLNQLVGQLLDRIDQPDLRPRAEFVRRISGLAETAMERHYARLVTEAAGDRSTDPPGGPPDGRLRTLFAPFPYFDNYCHLVDAELRGLAACARPVRSMAVCGAGPLPLTGILAHVITGATVTLVDHDPDAVASASTLVHLLEADGIIEPGSLLVMQDAAETADLTGNDVVLVASLVPQPALVAVAEQVAARFGPGVTLAARSARGLVARLAYEPVDLDPLLQMGLAHLGAVTPANVSGAHTVGAEESRPVAIAHPTVLNTTELLAPPDSRPHRARAADQQPRSTNEEHAFDDRASTP